MNIIILIHLYLINCFSFTINVKILLISMIITMTTSVMMTLQGQYCVTSFVFKIHLKNNQPTLFSQERTSHACILVFINKQPQVQVIYFSQIHLTGILTPVLKDLLSVKSTYKNNDKHLNLNQRTFNFRFSIFGHELWNHLKSLNLTVLFWEN